tara:strand:- start:150 stop:533 length:384 start_codon:yes stop_codon:yes gene_type:complete
MADFFKNNAVLLIALAGAAWVYREANEVAKKATKPIADILAEMQFMINGSNYVKFTVAGFVLDADAFDSDYRVYDSRLEAWLGSHDKHKDFLAEILDNQKRLKPVYHKLLGKLVDAATIYTASGVKL